MMKKYTNKTRFKAYYWFFSIFCMVLLSSILSVNLVSAFEFDNVIEEEPSLFSKYPIVKVRNAFGLGNLISRNEIIEHTEYCGNICWTDYNITLYSTQKLLDELKYSELKLSWRDSNILEQKVLIKIGEKISTRDKISCNPIIHPNGSIGNQCDIVKVQEIKPIWEEYNIGDTKDIGEYYVRIQGRKNNARDVIDFIPNFQGIIVSSHAIWNSTFNNKLTHVWQFNEGSGTVGKDEITLTGQNNATVQGGWAEGVNGSFSLNVTGGTSVGAIISGFINMPDGTADFSISFWAYNREVLGSGNGISWFYGNNSNVILNTNDGTIHFFVIGGGSVQGNRAGGTVLNEWTHYTGIRNSTIRKFYVNGVEIVSSTTTASITQDNINFGCQAGAVNCASGRIDEVYMWNRSLSFAEIFALNDSTFFSSSSLPTISLNEPIDNFNSSSSSIVFNCSVTEGGIANNVINLSLLINNQVNFTVFNTTPIQSLALERNLSIADGNHNWNCQAFTETQDNVTADERNFSIDQTAPLINVTSPRGLINFHLIGNNLSLNWSVSDLNLDTCFYDYNGTNTTVTCSDNNTLFVPETDLTSLIFYANDSSGNINSNFTEWEFELIGINQTFNATTFQTALESYDINIIFNSTKFTSITGQLIYDNTSISSTVSGSGDNLNFRASQLISSTSELSSLFFWNFSLTNATGTFNITTASNTNIQNVTPVIFDLCNTTLNVSYLNFTFTNETISQESVNATIVFTSTYYLNDATVNKTVTFSNSSENPSYNFCFSPSDRVINTESDIVYNNEESQQRIFTLTSLLSNLTSNQELFLLPTAKGLFSQFSTQDSVGNVLDGVRAVITRLLGGSTITVSSDFTDGSGVVVFFLDPDVTYTALFSLAGFSNNEFTFVPITDQRIVIMGSPITTIVNGTEISRNTTYQIIPRNNSLVNNTDVLFGFNVTSAETISFISMNITNTTGSQIGFQSSASQGLISQTINTGNNTRISGLFIIQTATETITVTKVWIVGNEFEGDYSIFRQLSLYTEYGFSDFYRLLIVIIIITGTLIFMSAGEITDTSESKIGVTILIIWMFSLVGWLNNPLVVAETGIAEFSRQYGVAILSTAAGSFFVLRRVFIRRI